MIPKHELLELAKLWGIEARMVEKDYVLGWVLAGINQHLALKQKWIFRGGTALKKCYFEHYRFSEDLDFTVTEAEHINADFLQQTFLEVLEWVYEQTGIEFLTKQVKFDMHPKPAKQYITGSIYYTGLLQQRGSPRKVLLDILGKELLVLNPQRRRIYHNYSDNPRDGLYSYCYCLEEIFAEKVRALAERARPRDLYDVVNLYRNSRSFVDKALLLSTLKQKCALKILKYLNSIQFIAMQNLKNSNKSGRTCLHIKLIIFQTLMNT